MRLRRSAKTTMAMWLVWTLVSVATVARTEAARVDASAEFRKSLPSQEIWAVPGAAVELPCNVSTPSGDFINTIFWYHGSNGTPIYSVDAREGDGRPPTERRLILPLPNVTEASEGDYRCRVDFRDSPTANRRVVVRVVEPPQPPVILDKDGVEVTGIAGPFREGFEMELQCSVTGGRPRPEVEWWVKDWMPPLQDATVDEVGTNAMGAPVSINRLVVKTVPRNLYGSTLECRTRSSRLADPIVRSVPFDLFLKPRKVELRSLDGDILSAGRVHVFECNVWGSIPAARITWRRDGEDLKAYEASSTRSENETSSRLRWIVRPQDNGRDLVCRAENSQFQGVQLEDRRRLFVVFPPEVSVVLRKDGDTSVVGTSKGATPPKDAEATWEKVLGPVLLLGDSAKLLCEVHANPPHTHITWFHKGVPLPDEARAGSATGGGGPVISSDGSELTLGPARPEHIGDYECEATNREGQVRSQPLHLRVHYAPRCAVGSERRRVGALPGKAVTVSCTVDAAPADDDLQFTWTEERIEKHSARSGGITSSRSTKRVDLTRVSSSGRTSHVTMAPPAAADEPVMLQCYASNSVGKQDPPCQVVVVLARAPDPPTECQLLNGSRGHLEVRCRPGDDGDLLQHFELEVREQAAGPDPAAAADAAAPALPSPATLSDQAQAVLPGGARGAHLHHYLRPEPHFVLEGLEGGRTYELEVYAVNEYNRSQPAVLLGDVRPHHTSAHAQDDPPPLASPHGESSEVSFGEGAGPLQPTPIILAVVIAAAVLLLGCMLATAALLACRRRCGPLPPLPPLPHMAPVHPATDQPVEMNSATPDNTKGVINKMADEAFR